MRERAMYKIDAKTLDVHDNFVGNFKLTNIEFVTQAK